ncbi:hypothetical protein CEXT_156951 [Caerostris extrusa]|uniref:Uncharacterized protein n=1 Tax=Caerostris extrusa TaxID=172846 RepID=A0AAV4P0C8_CAEEX|nr:hypothetical protein CEXT_156951 [Caerostris extrusa]
MRSSGNGRNDRRDRCRETLHMQMRPHSFPRAEPGGGETRALRLNASEKNASRNNCVPLPPRSATLLLFQFG